MILRSVAGQPILIGPLLAVADGTAQTTGAAIAVRKDGTDVGTPGGTLAHVDSGVWQYTPSQNETDCGIVGLILTKAGAAAVPLNVLTTRLPVQTTGAVPAVAAGSSGGLPLIGSAPLTNLDASIAAVKAKTDNLPTDPADASDIAAAFGTVNTTLGAIAGYIDTEVAAIKAKTDNLPAAFPANFAALGINASGHVARVTLADTLTTYTGNTPQTGDSYARLGAPAGASLAADVAAVNSAVAALGTGISLDSGTVSTGTSATSFTATGGTLNATSGAYNGMFLLFQSGALAGERRTILAHTVSGSTHTFTFSTGFSAAPAAGVAFIVG
jgi:hypothetical protein